MPMANIDTSWIKFGAIKAIAFLGKDVIAFASGIYIIFINLNTKDERVEKFDNRERGDGACCLTGHPVVPMFAIAERCLNPKISIFTYPKINKVSSCIYKSIKRQNGFISSTFVGTEYLITLTSIPDFQLIVWLWRTGENLKVIDTKIMDDIQQITCSPSSPFWLTQMGENTGQLILYEMTVCSKIILLTPTSNFISSEQIVSSSWTQDGNLLLCDNLGNVSLFYCDGKRRHVIVNSNIQLASHWRPSVVDFRGGAVVVNTNSQLLFYRKLSIERVKSSSPWKFIWQIETSSPPIFIIRHPKRDSLLFHTDKGEIFEVSVGDDDVPRMQMICCQGSGYLFLVSIHPDGQRIGVIDTFNRLIIMESHTGNLLSITSLDSYGKILQATNHNILPLIVTTTETGKCNIISVIDVAKPVTIKSIYLTKKPLDKLKFSYNGDTLGVANNIDGQLFMINNFKNMKLNVLTVLDVPEKIVDFLIYKNKNECLVILVLIKAHSSIYIGNHVMIYTLNESTLTPEIDRVVELPNIFKSLHYGETAYEIIANPYLTKQLYVMNISENYQMITLTDASLLSHQLRTVNINSGSKIILTFGYDGIVIIKNKMNIHLTIKMLVCHHRSECGIKFAIACLHQNIIMCLGRNGSLIATKLSQLSVLNSSLELNDNRSNYVDALRILSTFTQIELSDEMTWIELRHEEKLKKECEEMAVKRALILQDFHDLKKRLKKMLDANENELDDAKLSIAKFDLNIEIRNEKIKLNTIKKETLMKDVEEQIYCHEKLTSYLRETYWNSMRVTSCSLISFDGKICVNNYPLPVEVTHNEKYYQEWPDSNDISQQISSTEQIISNSNEPTDECVKSKDIKILEAIEGDEKEQLAMSGTTSHRWIHEDSIEIFNQINRDESCTGITMRSITKLREFKLKEYFNKLFEKIQIMKRDEIKLAKERIARINYCLSELKEMFGIDIIVNYDDINLNWHQSERPQLIFTVEDSEVYKSINGPINKSSEKCVNESNSDDEKTNSRGFFYEETLDKIMDSVLEVRWEDEIKKDIVKPNCLSKNIENCSEIELEMIRNYKKSVENLEIERLKYKSILEKEISLVQDLLRKNVDNFNCHLKKFYFERIKIESAILQENLMYLRESQRHQLHQQSMLEIFRIETDELNPAIMEIKRLSEESIILESTVNETKNRYENLIKREKLLEGKFRGEFPDLKQPMVEHLLRHYKKRPRNIHLTCTSITYLTEMNKCIMSGEKSEILPGECIEFLKGMQNLDVMPSNLPSQIDSNHWLILCRIRRAKVEIENRLKSCAVELAEAEQTFSSHQKTIQNIQNRVHQIREKIDDIRRRDYEKSRNIEVQLVLKMGQIEIQLCGHSSELDNAVLVPFAEVLRANDSIVKAGHKKIAAMNKTIEFRRTIEWREWRHRCLKLTLEDMRDELKVLQGVKVTKEIQKYLMRHLHMIESSKDTETWERSLMLTKKRYTEIVEDEKKQLIDITKRINEWKLKNNKLIDEINELQLANTKLLFSSNDEKRVNDKNFRQEKLIAIMKRNRLITRVQENYEDLLMLRSQLELLRLKTYPTLRMKDLMRDKRKNQK